MRFNSPRQLIELLILACRRRTTPTRPAETIARSRKRMRKHIRWYRSADNSNRKESHSFGAPCLVRPSNKLHRYPSHRGLKLLFILKSPPRTSNGALFTPLLLLLLLLRRRDGHWIISAVLPTAPRPTYDYTTVVCTSSR